jgi:hypothetical protein
VWIRKLDPPANRQNPAAVTDFLNPTPQSRLTADAETFLHRLVLLAVLLRRPDEQAEDDEDCKQEEDNKNDFDSRLHTTMIRDRRPGKEQELVDL